MQEKGFELVFTSKKFKFSPVKLPQLAKLTIL